VSCAIITLTWSNHIAQTVIQSKHRRQAHVWLGRLFHLSKWSSIVSDLRIKGTVRWFDGSKGFGYIQSEQGHQVFVHYTAISDKGLRNLSPGQQVEFVVQESVRGPQAEKVVRL
jgi:CspA family cold shock protein